MLPEDPDDDLDDDDEDDIDDDGGGEDDEDEDDEDEDEEEEETWQVSDSPFSGVGLSLTSGFDLLDSVRFTSSSKLG